MDKVKDIQVKEKCNSPDHDPPTMICLPSGVYEHTCSGCGDKQTVFIPPEPTM